MTGGEYTDRWLADIQGRPVRAVLGFCVGGVFAAPIAEQVARAQGQAPTLVLFDPERPDADLLLRHYREVINGLVRAMSDQEADAARRAGEQARHAAGKLPAFAAELSKLLRDFGAPAFERSGLDATRAAELVDTFAAFLAYLAAAADIDPEPVWAQAVAIGSNTENNGLNCLTQAQRSGLVHREITFDLPHGELLRDPRVAHAVGGLLV